jgi:hypothetical protein
MSNEILIYGLHINENIQLNVSNKIDSEIGCVGRDEG